MIILYGFGPGLGQPDLSPFVMKVMALLTMAGLPFRVETGFKAISGAPYGKLPYIRDGDKVIADSHLIRRHLETAHGVDFSAGYSAEALASGLMAERMFEESTYFALLRRRWIDADGWALFKPAAFGELPAPLQFVVPAIARRSVRKALHGQGTGRLPQAELDRRCREEVGALAALLGDRIYLLGERISGVDATMAAFLTAASTPTIANVVRSEIEAHPNLAAYRNRLKAMFFAEPGPQIH